MATETAGLTEAALEIKSCLVGQLQTWPLADILLWLHQSNRSAILRVGSGPIHAMIFVEGGCLRRVEYGQVSGDQALFELLSLADAPFNLMLREPPEVRANVRRPLPELLLQCVVAGDERRRHQALPLA